MRYFKVRSPNFFAIHSGIFLPALNGRKINTPIELNKKCTIASVRAASDLKSAAKKAVKVVPILAPIINGKAFFNEIRFVATRGTIREVVIELD